MKLREKIILAMMASFGVLTVVGFIYAMHCVTRVINYNLSYKSMVVETIKDNVKGECLK